MPSASICGETVSRRVDHPLGGGLGVWVCNLTMDHPYDHMAFYDTDVVFGANNNCDCGGIEHQERLRSLNQFIIQWNDSEVTYVAGEFGAEPSRRYDMQIKVNPRDRRLVKARRLP